MRYGMGLVMLLAAVAGCHVPIVQQNLPPAPRLAEPGPGVGGPGPGVMAFPPVAPAPILTSQVQFVGPEGMIIAWSVSAPGAFDSEPLIAPAKYNFPQGAIYQLRLTNVQGRPGVELYPTLEVAPVMPRTAAFLAHNTVPVQFTNEDFDQVLSGNFVTKVVYLPDPEFQQLAVAGVDTLVSTRLDPGVDPIVEADRKGAILAIVRLGNKDLQVPGVNGVMPASYMGPGGMIGPGGMPCPPGLGAGHPTLPGMVAGATAPQYGMPITGTPIGLPGPPHIPLGVPAGLKSHTMANHTKVHLPGPTEQVRIDVKQTPGMTYPHPANHVRIHEQTGTGPMVFRQPFDSKHQVIGGGVQGGVPCPPEAAGYPMAPNGAMPTE